MAKMTDEEADVLDEYYTKNPPIPGPNGTGFFTHCRNKRGGKQKPNSNPGIPKDAYRIASDG